jgi:hypothetical protein
MKIFSVLATTAALLSCGASGWKLRLFEEKNFLGKSIAFQGKTKIGTSGCMKLEYNDKGKIGKLKGVSSIWFSDEYKAKDKVYCSIWHYYDNEKCEAKGLSDASASDSFDYHESLRIEKASYMV